jgi:hypothetical protein
MMQRIEGMPENVIAVTAHGSVTGEDYEKVLIPAIRDGF